MTSHRPFRTVRAVHTRVAPENTTPIGDNKNPAGRVSWVYVYQCALLSDARNLGRRRCRIAGGSVVPCASTGGLSCSEALSVFVFPKTLSCSSVRTSRRKPKHSDGCSSRVLLMTDSTDALPLPSRFLDLLRYQLQRYTSIGRVYGTFSRNRRKHHRRLRRLSSSSDTRTIDVCSTP